MITTSDTVIRIVFPNALSSIPNQTCSQWLQAKRHYYQVPSPTVGSLGSDYIIISVDHCLRCRILKHRDLMDLRSWFCWMGEWGCCLPSCCETLVRWSPRSWPAQGQVRARPRGVSLVLWGQHSPVSETAASRSCTAAGGKDDHMSSNRLHRKSHWLNLILPACRSVEVTHSA